MDPKDCVDTIDDARVVAAIQAAEARCRGEIRVHVTREPVGDAQGAAVLVFEALGMADTEERNGVLIYVSPRSQTFAIIGDSGIDQKCGRTFWHEVAEAMRADFREHRFTEGLVRGVERAGEELHRYFPREGGRADVNELPDAISRD